MLTGVLKSSRHVVA